MGCAADRFGPEEDSLKPKMLQIGFEKHNADKIVTTILRYARASENLSESQFAAIQKALKLVDKSAGGKIKELYDIHFITQSTYVLLVTGILLSHSTALDKSSALFDVYDTASDGALTDKAVEAMIGELFFVATDALKPTYGDIEGREGKYFEEAERNIAKGVKEAKNAVLAGARSIPRSDFISKMANFQSGILLVQAGLRKYLKDQSPPAGIPPPTSLPGLSTPQPSS